MKLDDIPAKLSCIPPIPVKHMPEYPANECHNNVRMKVQKEGGEAIRGWRIIREKNVAWAIDHSVWKSPDGAVVDVTEDHPEASTIEGSEECCFVPNDGKGNHADMVFPLTDNKQTKKSVIKLRRMLWETERVSKKTGIDIMNVMRNSKWR